MIEQLRATRGDANHEAYYWLKKLEKANGKRSSFQHASGEGVLSLENLKARLAEME